MNAKMWVGLLLVASSYLQLLVPRWMFVEPSHFFHGYPVVPGTILAVFTSLLALGVIVFSEGVCQRFAAPSLSHLAMQDGWSLTRVALAAAGSGLIMEFFAQWLGRLWIYPYWTPWFYWLVLIPGYVFYWTLITESYLAVKAVLDATTRPHGRSDQRHSGPLSPHLLGALGVVLVVAVTELYARWYMERGGYVFALTAAARDAPPFTYVLLASAGMWLVAEWGLRRRNTPLLIGSALQGYWTPAAAVLGSSLLLSLAMETQNAANQYWTYTHFPGSDITLFGTALSVFAIWPLQYIVFLSIPSLFAPALATLFWQPTK